MKKITAFIGSARKKATYQAIQEFERNLKQHEEIDFEYVFLSEYDFVYNSFIEVVKKWQTNGKMRSDIDAEMIMGIFAAIINVDTHKEEIGLQYFPLVLEYLGEFAMKGLMDCSKKE